MGWFDREPDVAPQPREAKYTVAKTEALIESFGLLRLQVRDPRLKVLITKVVNGAIPYLTSVSGGKPSGEHISRMMTSFEMLTKALEGYVKIQENPDAYTSHGDPRDLMKRGFEAVEQYWRQLSSPQSAGGDLGAYEALTNYLRSNPNS